MIGKEGAGVYQMNGQPTAQNNRETGCDGEFPGFRNHQNPQHMAELAEHWNIDVNKLPHWALPTPVMSLLQHIDAGTIHFIWISGTNPAVSLPESDRVRRLLTKKELFVVAQDIFPTETTELADVVLPAAMWAEKTGCFVSRDGYLTFSRRLMLLT
jgi:ferredoxin-nitrate reductase